MDKETQKAVQSLLKNSELGDTDLESIFGDKNGVAVMAMCWQNGAEQIHLAEVYLMLKYINGGDSEIGFTGEFDSKEAKAFLLGLKALSTLMIACWKENLENQGAESPQESNED